MKEKLLEDLKDAMKNKDTVKKNTIQMVRAQVLQTEKDKQIELDNNSILEIISKQVKQKNDAIVEFEKANRQDLIEQTKLEIEILKNYLPKQLSMEEVEKIVAAEKESLGLTSIKELGTLIKAVKIKVGAGSDGKTISDAAKKVLISGN